MKKVERLEQITKGFASKHRIAILLFIARTPHADVDTISHQLELGYKTTSEHLRKMLLADLIEKEYEGNYVLHTLTPTGKRVLSFLQRM